MIRLTHVSQRYGAQVALDDVNFEVNAGDFCVVLGPSGAGKTSLLRLLTMEELPTSGQVQVGSFVSGRLGRGQRAATAPHARRRVRGLQAARGPQPVRERGARPAHPGRVGPRHARASRRRGAGAGRPARAARTPSRANSRPGRSSAPASPARSSTARTWCSPTSRPATSIRRRRGDPRPAVRDPPRRHDGRCWRPTTRTSPPGLAARGARLVEIGGRRAGRGRSPVNRLAYFIVEAWRGMWHHRSLTLTAIASVAGALLTIGGVPALHRQRAAGADVARRPPRGRGLPARRRPGRRRCRTCARAWTRCTASSTYVSKQEAWDEFARELGGDELLKAVGENPLPASIRLRLRPEYLHFAAMERIADVLAGEPWSRRCASAASGCAGSTASPPAWPRSTWRSRSSVALGVLLVVANTIRLTVIARRGTAAHPGAGRRRARVPARAARARGRAAWPPSRPCSRSALLAGAGAWLDGRPFALVPLPWRWAVAFVGSAALLGCAGSLLALVTVSRKH